MKVRGGTDPKEEEEEKENEGEMEVEEAEDEEKVGVEEEGGGEGGGGERGRRIGRDRKEERKGGRDGGQEHKEAGGGQEGEGGSRRRGWEEAAFWYQVLIDGVSEIFYLIRGKDEQLDDVALDETISRPDRPEGSARPSRRQTCSRQTADIQQSREQGGVTHQWTKQLIHPLQLSHPTPPSTLSPLFSTVSQSLISFSLSLSPCSLRRPLTMLIVDVELQRDHHDRDVEQQDPRLPAVQEAFLREGVSSSEEEERVHRQ